MSISDIILFLMNNPCEDPEVLKVIFYIKLLMNAAFIIVPMVLIVLIIFDFVKSVMASTEDVQKKNVKIIIKRIVYCIFLFFVTPIVNICFSAFETSGNSEFIESNGTNYLSCWANASDIDTINAFEITAKFNGDGGQVYGGTTKSCGGSQYCEISVLPNAVKKGYYFTGWSNNGCYNTVKNDKLVLEKNGNNNYVACWDENSNSANSGSNGITSTANSSANGILSVVNSINISNASGFWWPIAAGSNGKPKTTNISSTYGTRKLNGKTSSHLGIDISGGSSPDIIASYDGIVYSVVNKKGNSKSPDYGTHVILQHNYNGETLYTIYGHMKYNSIPSNITKGAKVTAGTKIGIMGDTGYSFGTHLHFEMRKGSYSPRSKVAVNPLNYISASNPYPEKKESSSGSSTSNNNNSTTSTKKCNGRSVNIEQKDGVTYINGIIVVNKTYSLPKSYKSNNLKKGRDEDKEKYYMDKTALDAFNEMKSAIKKEKNANIYIYSGYRSYDTQNKTYNSFVNGEGKTAADTKSARPGHSEHQTGLSVDINNVKNSFKDTTEGKWLKDNAYKYGFILRYPEGKTNETGYMFEPWHYRYVGKELAKELYNNGNWLTMEEYFCIDSKY